jgi:pimeloyl-ACP methyl ester carboxylesterase
MPWHDKDNPRMY